jgi:hypothetical protein
MVPLMPLEVSCTGTHPNDPVSRGSLHNVDYLWVHTMPTQIIPLVQQGLLAELKLVSQHSFHKKIYDGLNLANNPCNIHGATLAEPLHVIDLGLFKYAIEQFCVALGMSPPQLGKKRFSSLVPQLLMEVDSWARHIG